ncbi:MAG TPA: hypothetical protein VFQ92_02035 [Blastocatellia bacterium]|nr:hypothetical protein [Blastocatellia bacterium]
MRTPAGTGLLGTLQTADSSLLRIFNAVPGGLVFSGWDTAVIGLGTSVFALSHPGGGLPPSIESYLRSASGSITSTTTACSATGLVSGLTSTRREGAAL